MTGSAYWIRTVVTVLAVAAVGASTAGAVFEVLGQHWGSAGVWALCAVAMVIVATWRPARRFKHGR
jgi:hypothetical protein